MDEARVESIGKIREKEEGEREARRAVQSRWAHWKGRQRPDRAIAAQRCSEVYSRLAVSGTRTDSESKELYRTLGKRGRGAL